MLNLPFREQTLLIAATALYVLAALLALLQLANPQKKLTALLPQTISVAAILQAVILAIRAQTIGAFPLTSLFESMLFLTIIFSIIYAVLLNSIKQPWFTALIAWTLLTVSVLTDLTAAPAVPPTPDALKPWVIIHALCMILGAAMILLSIVTAIVYLIGSNRLKTKKIGKVFGLIPNIEKLQRINILALRLALLTVTLGTLSGLAGFMHMAKNTETTLTYWLFDSKVIGISLSWLIIAIVTLLHQLGKIRGKRIAQWSIVVFVWIIFSFVGSHLLCKTKHDFSQTTTTQQDDNITPTQAKEAN